MEISDLFDDLCDLDPPWSKDKHARCVQHENFRCHSLRSLSAQCCVRHIPILKKHFTSLPSDVLHTLLLEAVRSESRPAVIFLLTIWSLTVVDLGILTDLNQQQIFLNETSHRAKFIADTLVEGLVKCRSVSHIRSVKLSKDRLGLFIGSAFLKIPLIMVKKCSGNELFGHLKHLDDLLDIRQCVKNITKSGSSNRAPMPTPQPLEISMSLVVSPKGPGSNLKLCLVSLALQSLCNVTFIVENLAFCDFSKYKSAGFIIESFKNPQTIKKMVFSHSAEVNNVSHSLEILHGLQLSLISLTNLRSLSFFNENFSLPDQENHMSNSIKATFDVMELFYSLTNLKELTLPGCLLAGKLGHLSALRQPLTRLNIAATMLLEDDLRYLVDSHHCLGLESLNISFNDLHAICDLFCMFISRLVKLTHLHCEGCELNANALLSVVTALSVAQTVQVLDISRNDLLNFSEHVLVLESCYKLACNLRHVVFLPALTAFDEDICGDEVMLSPEQVIYLITMGKNCNINVS